MQSHKIKRRSLLQGLVDRLVTRVQRFPDATSSYTVERDVRIPMRDGVELLADIYTPTGPVSGTMLTRSPYGWNLVMSSLTGGVYASRGYRMILAKCRGTFGSGGDFDPLRNEISDGADTVEWMRNQPWFEGRFATFGGSYLGFTQWSLLVDPPPELATAVISIAPHDFYRSIYQNGAFALDNYLSWAHQVGHQEEVGMFANLLKQKKIRRMIRDAEEQLPVLQGTDQLLQGRSTFFREWATRRDPDDPYWATMRLGEALDRVQVPVLLQNGWQDLFLEQTFEQYQHLDSRGVTVGMTVGPWNHEGMVTEGKDIPVRETLDWLDEHLAGTGTGKRTRPIRLYVTGANHWREYEKWPPATTAQLLYPHSDGTLGNDPVTADASASFTFAPEDPTPSIGGRSLFESGYMDDSALAERQDTLDFTTAPLSAALEIQGRPQLRLSHTTDNPHADLFVRLSEVFTDGTSRNVSEGFLRLNPDNANGDINMELDQVAHRFSVGNRIRLVVAGGCFPRWERNLGTGENPVESTSMASSTRTISMAGTALTLPVFLDPD